MRKRDQASLDAASLDELVEEITVDANGEDEQLWAFRQAFEDNVSVPCEATVIGEPVKVMKFDYDGNNRRGLTAMCRRADGTQTHSGGFRSGDSREHVRRALPGCVSQMDGACATPTRYSRQNRQQTAVAPAILTVPSNWWSCRSNRSLRAAACWAATEPSRSALAGSGT